MLKHDISFLQIQKITQFCELYNLENPLIPVMEEFEWILTYLHDCISSHTRYLKNCERILEQVCPDEIRIRNDISKRYQDALNKYSAFYWHDGFYSTVHLAMTNKGENNE